MKPYVLKDIGINDLVVFNQIVAVMNALPEIDLNVETSMNGQKKLVSCHMLGRAFARFFPVMCKDGHYFTPGWEHCWLETKNGNIIDHYPWGTVGGPFLVYNDFCIPGKHLYQEAKVAVTDEEDFLHDTEVVCKIVEQTLRQLGFRAGP